MARSSLRMVVGLVVPPRTVGSLAMTRHWVRGDLDQRDDDAAADRIASVQPGQRATARARACPGRPAPRVARAPSSCRGRDGVRRTALRPRPTPRRATHAPRRPARAMAPALAVELLAGHRRGASGSACSRRSCPMRDGASPGRPSMPSAASGAGEELGRRRGGGRQRRPPSPAPAARASSCLRGAHRARARTCAGLSLCATTQASSVGLVIDHGREQPRGRGLVARRTARR